MRPCGAVHRNPTAYRIRRSDVGVGGVPSIVTGARPMGTNAISLKPASLHPIQLHVVPSLDDRNRLTTAFRCLLAIPHLLLVGGPVALALAWSSRPDADVRVGWGTGGALGAVAAVCAIIVWFAIVFTGTAPEGL